MYESQDLKISKGDILWADGFRLVRSAGKKRIVLSRSPFMSFQTPVLERAYDQHRGYWFIKTPGEPFVPEAFFEAVQAVVVPKKEDTAVAAITEVLWGPIDEDIVLFEGVRDYKPRTQYGFSYDQVEIIYRTLKAYLAHSDPKQMLATVRGFCFDADTWPEAFGLYLKGDPVLRDYVLHHQGESIKLWLGGLSPAGQKAFSLGECTTE